MVYQYNTTCATKSTPPGSTNQGDQAPSPKVQKHGDKTHNKTNQARRRQKIKGNTHGLEGERVGEPTKRTKLEL